MSIRVDGGGSAGSQSNVDAQLAAARAAIQRAQEAARKAAEARQRANAARSQFEKSPNADTLSNYNYQATGDAATADQDALKATNDAEAAMRQANAAAAANGSAAPFPQINGPDLNTSSFDPAAGRSSLTGSPTQFSPEAVRLNLQADQSYAQLVQDPATARALDTLKITDGESLRALGTSLSNNTLGLQPTKQAALSQLQAAQPSVYSSIVQAAQTFTSGTVAGAEPAGKSSSPDAAAANIRRAESDYKNAHEQVTTLDQKLGGELAKLGPALTTDQKQAYIKAFHDKYKSAYDADSKAEGALALALNDPNLDAAVQKDPKLAYTVGDGAKLLAGTPHSVEVLQWANHAFDPSNPASAAYSKISQPLTAPGPRGVPLTVHDAINLSDDILGPSLSGAAGEYAAQSGGDAQLAFAKYKSLVGNLTGVVKGAFKAKGGEALLSNIERAVSSGDLSGLASDYTNVSGKVGNGLGAAGLVFAGLSAKTAAQKGDYATLVQSLANAGRSGTQLLASALHTFTGAGRIAGEEGFVAAGFLDRLAPGLGVIANAIQLGKDGSALLNDPSIGNGVAAVGDLIALVGSGVAVAVPGVGQIIEGVGLVISGIGQLLTGNKAQEELNQEEKGLLTQAGLSSQTAQGLSSADNETLRQIQQALQLSPEQVQTLASNHAEILAAPGYVQSIVDVANACGIKGKDFNAFVDGLAKDQPANYLNLFFAQRENEDGVHNADHAQVLRTLVDSGFPTASKLAHQVSPTLYGQDAQKAQQADRDYERAFGDVPSVTNLLKSNNSPAYQAEIIQRLKKDGRLDFFVSQLSGAYHYNDWNTAFLHGLQSAAQQGVISQADLNKYTPGLQ